MSKLHMLIAEGNLVKDPELRHLDGGRTVLNCRVAVSEWMGEGKPEAVAYYNLPFWTDQQQKRVSDMHLQKGDTVQFVGKPFYRPRIDEQGNARCEIDIKWITSFEWKKRKWSKGDAAPESEAVGVAESGPGKVRDLDSLSDDDLPF